FSAGATHSQYSELSSENKTEWDVSGAGRADITTGMSLTALGSHVSTFEARTSEDQIGAAEPTPYRRSDARLDLSYNPYRLGVKLESEFIRYDYSPTHLLQSFGGGTLDNEDRNRNEYLVSATFLDEFSPGYGAFFRPSYSERIYDLNTGRAAGRNSQTY